MPTDLSVRVPARTSFDEKGLLKTLRDQNNAPTFENCTHLHLSFSKIRHHMRYAFVTFGFLIVAPTQRVVFRPENKGFACVCVFYRHYCKWKMRLFPRTQTQLDVFIIEIDEQANWTGLVDFSDVSRCRNSLMIISESFN